jgi:hypothetical protein
MSQNQKKKCLKFTPVEDKLLLHFVQIYGTNKWEEIAKNLIDRTPKQCHDRYCTYLSPAKNRFPWSIEEENRLIYFVCIHGPHFQDILHYFPGRKVSDLKNRWYIHIMRRKINQEAPNQKSKYIPEI